MLITVVNAIQSVVLENIYIVNCFKLSEKAITKACDTVLGCCKTHCTGE